MYKAEQLNLFEIEPEDSEAIYGADIPFLVVETTLTPTLTPIICNTIIITL